VISGYLRTKSRLEAPNHWLNIARKQVCGLFYDTLVKKEDVKRTGMPLHEFEYDREGKLIVDDENGSITVKTDSIEYTFRRP
jgi:hypothetical protein